ncbi:hypothetical protein MOKP44_38390 [Mycobacterium avium subsp. hominissuis]
MLFQDDDRDSGPGEQQRVHHPGGTAPGNAHLSPDHLRRLPQAAIRAGLIRELPLPFGGQAQCLAP